MILKIEVLNNSSKYKLIDNVEEFNYEYISIKDLSRTIDALRRDSIGCEVINLVNESKPGNFVLVSIEKRERPFGIRYILSNMSIFVLNDKGDTIERVRY